MITTEPPPAVRRFWDEIAKPGYELMVEAIGPGKPVDGLREAGRFFREHGVQSRPIHAHGIDLVSSAPHVYVDRTHAEPFEEVFRPGNVIMVEPNPITADGTLGMFVGHTFVVTEEGRECLDDFPVELVVTGEYRRRAEVSWDGPTAQVRRSYADLQEATEFGAAGVAIATLNRLGGFVVMERSRKGTGFDYWISRHGDLCGPLVQNCTPLEVSGILTGDDAELKRRVRIKREQVAIAKTNDRRVAVVEFGMPRTRIVRS